MKIDMTHDVLKPAPAGTLQKVEGSQDGRFGEILKETMGTGSGPRPAAQGPALATPIGGLCLDPFSLSTETPLIEQTERLLDTLDAYRQKLGDREVALKDMDPLIHEIKGQSEGLSSKVDALPDADPLREILNQTLIISSLEVLKFNRGDYSSM
jgi:hypothetical protein